MAEPKEPKFDHSDHSNQKDEYSKKLERLIELKAQNERDIAKMQDQVSGVRKLIDRAESSGRDSSRLKDLMDNSLQVVVEFEEINKVLLEQEKNYRKIIASLSELDDIDREWLLSLDDSATKH